jgi:chemotaxis protein MotB
MSDDTQQPIVVKRIKKGGGGAHGGAWKIAYADFVTAMMAFFLLMWLLGSTAQGDLDGIAEHFQNPLKLSLHGGSGVGDSSSIIQGGGEDLTRAVGQVKRGDVVDRRTINLDAATARTRDGADREDVLAAERREERARLIDLKGRIEAIIEADPALRPFKDQILMDITFEGLRIQLVDEQNRPMFLSGSATLRPYTRDLLRAIGRALNDVPNRISLSGHTDSAPYVGGELGFSNWELSSNRANASRRELLGGGLDSGKIIRVVGLADTIHLNRDDPLDPTNRRISIIVMNKQAEEAARSEGSTVEYRTDGAVEGSSFMPQGR